MNATTHAVFGVAALVGASLIAGYEPPLYAYPAAVVAAWVPDVDNPRSRLGNGLSRLKNPALNLLARPVSWALRVTSFVLFRTVGHRTLTHSLLGVAVFIALVSPFAPRRRRLEYQRHTASVAGGVAFQALTPRCPIRGSGGVRRGSFGRRGGGVRNLRATPHARQCVRARSFLATPGLAGSSGGSAG